MKEKNEKELLQAQHRVEEAQQRNRSKERSKRTQRLIVTGAILESVLPQVKNMTPEALKAELKTKLGEP
jgi:hypothetical protein